MEALRSSTKRPHSATPPPENLPQMDGACLGKPDGAEDAAPPTKAVKADGATAATAVGADDTPATPAMPKFLQLGDAG
jgi:hypothetical protein